MIRNLSIKNLISNRETTHNLEEIEGTTIVLINQGVTEASLMGIKDIVVHHKKIFTTPTVVQVRVIVITKDIIVEVVTNVTREEVIIVLVREVKNQGEAIIETAKILTKGLKIIIQEIILGEDSMKILQIHKAITIEDGFKILKWRQDLMPTTRL